MKKTLIILILALAYQFTNAQVKVLGKIEPNGATDKYPTHVDSLGRGGLITAASWQERNAIPAARRKAGMLVRVKSASVDSTYTLGVGLTNTDWVPFVLSGSSGSIWGSIAGSLQDQTDLKTAFDAKVSSAISVTYSELTTLISSNALRPQQTYLISDFQTVHTIPFSSPATLNTGVVEPIVVTAASTNSIGPEARSIVYPEDILIYQVANKTGSTKGFVLMRHDTKLNVRLPYDFRNCKFRRWKFNPATWSNIGFSKANVVQYNSKIYYCFQTHATSQQPDISPLYWREMLQNNDQYLWASSANWSITQGASIGGNIVIPVNAADYIDTHTFSNYVAGSIGNVIYEGIDNLAANLVVYTNSQAGAFVDNKFGASSGNNTFAVMGTFYCRFNEFNFCSALVLTGNNSGSASVNQAFSYNVLPYVQAIAFNPTLATRNDVGFLYHSAIGKDFSYNRGTKIAYTSLPYTFRNNNFNNFGSLQLYNTNQQIVGCQFNSNVGMVHHSNNIGNTLAWTQTQDLVDKTFVGDIISDSRTPNANTDAATKSVIYTALPDMDISGKADLSGATFTGNVLAQTSNEFGSSTVAVRGWGTSTDAAVLTTNATNIGQLKLNDAILQSSATGVRYISLPATAGTIALTSQLPNITGKANLAGGNSFDGNQNVNGNIFIDHSYNALNGIGINRGLTVSSKGREDGEIVEEKVAMLNGVGLKLGFDTISPALFTSYNYDEIVFAQSLGNTKRLRRGMANGNVVNTLPSSSGTLALTSDLEGKANLTGGNTFTGNQNVNGTMSGISTADTWIGGKFGSADGSDLLVAGNLGGTATIGAHNSTLTDWANLSINSRGGNVGIGTENPTQKLDVAGNARIMGTLYPEGITIDQGDVTFMNGSELKLNYEGDPLRNVKLTHSNISISSNYLDFPMTTTIVNNVDAATLTRTVVLPATSGTLALTSDVPKMFTYTTIENVDQNEIEHNLGYTPTSAIASINNYINPTTYIRSVEISGSIIVVKTSTILPVGTKISIMVK